ncbi:hypothetical protein U9M48_033013 [Paspalum notatum var. saurae]|uniref:Acid phosphatase/vanadium-dependent haloperoxidase-related protein n=1 Tax=Paspalum notatum var. saurae TaxID=547442 RepID=A0AAQ3X698_PASNO
MGMTAAAADVVNYPLVAALLAFVFAQSSKFFTTWLFFVLLLGLTARLQMLCHELSIGYFVYERYKDNRWDVRQLIASGGMPSSHSATVTALAVAVGIQEGFRSATFATALVFAWVVMHDAFGVRLHAGKQAEVLNQIVFELPEEHPLSETKPLREILGHTVPQVVAGCILGILMAVVMRLALRSS